MSFLLNKRVTVLLGAAVLSGALLWTGETLRAQTANPDVARAKAGLPPRVALTRETAAKNFVTLLEIVSSPVRFAQAPDPLLWSSISLPSDINMVEPLLQKLGAQWKEPIQVLKVQSEDTDSATVVFESVPQTTSRPLVLVREGDGWCVDMIETYAKWNDLTGPAKSQAIVQLTSEANRARDNARRSSCQSNLKQVALGMMQYIQDYDERTPPTKNWIDVLQPYVKSEQIFICPSVDDPKGYGYAYNSNFAQKNFAAVQSPSLTASVYETSILKRNAFGPGDNRAYRHLDGSNYAYGDGHVKWLKKENSPLFTLK
jgi:prepilin-type processing-associated H-X9-DG protein